MKIGEGERDEIGDRGCLNREGVGVLGRVVGFVGWYVGKCFRSKLVVRRGFYIWVGVVGGRLWFW